MKNAGFIYLLFQIILNFTTVHSSRAQQYDTISQFKEPITLDSFVLKTNFDIQSFIRRVRNDTTFYKAFKSMKLADYHAVNDYTVLGKDKKVVASMHCKSQQTVKNGCRTTKQTEKKVTGDFYKANGNYNYYTADLFGFLFFAPQPECNLSDIVAGSNDNKGKTRMEKNKYELKQLMFNPGSKVEGVPMMGDKAAIFDKDEMKKYDFKVAVATFEGIDCFVFTIKPKSRYAHKTVYNELITWFRKSDYSIVARDYSLSYHTFVYDFDVTMKVRMLQMGGKLYPSHIYYDGNWHIFTKKRERLQVKMDVTYDKSLK